MNSTLRLGILGTGNIARQLATGVNSSSRCRLACVGSRQLELARSFADAFGIPQAAGGYQQVIDSPDVDAIYVSLPNSMHREWTIRALRAGKHVLCEKPIAANAKQAEEMFDTARRCGRVLVEAFMYRAHPLTRAVLAAIRDRAVGQVTLIRTSFCYRTRRIEGNIRFDAALAGGALMDVGCYCINFSRLIAGCEPQSIQAAGQLHPSGVDEAAIGMLAFPNSILASFTCGMTLQADNAAYVCGTDGYIEIPVPWKPPPGQASFTIAQSTPPRMDMATGRAPSPPPRQTRVVETPMDVFGVEVDDFAATVLDGAPPMMTPADSLGNMRVLDEMRRQIGVST